MKGFGEPPQPRDRFEACVNGRALRQALIAAAGKHTWESGYIEALFDVGEQLHRLFTPRFKTVWEAVGTPPGPWATPDKQAGLPAVPSSAGGAMTLALGQDQVPFGPA